MFQNIPKEKVLEIVRKGPTIPGKISKELSSDTMLIGAILSTLITQGAVRVSTLKIGGTPVYYVPDQESRLEEYMRYLNDKDQKTVLLLKEQKVLLDSSQDPLTRVSLRTVKDFAKTIEVIHGNDKELFWRYFLTSKEEAEDLAKKILAEIKIAKETEESAKKELETRAKALSEESAKTGLEENEDAGLESSEKAELGAGINAEPEKKEDTLVLQHAASQAGGEEKTLDAKDSVSEEKHAAHHKKTPLHEKKTARSEESRDIGKENFIEMIQRHLLRQNLDIISKEKIKKTEYRMVLKDHSTNEYFYCAAKDKKTITEGDISTAYVFAHTKKMPCIFLMTGTLNKKAEQMLEKEFAGIKVERISL